MELIVVIGIIGVLSGVLIAGFSGTTESARAAKCLANLHQLAAVWDSGRAGSQEHLEMNKTQRGSGRSQKTYYEEQGWISSATKGLYPSASHQGFQPIGMFETDRERVEFAFTNGWMCTALGGDRSVLVCPTHAKKLGKKSKANWSYFMNAAFGWDACQGGYTYSNRINDGCLYRRHLTNADRLLIFAEIPFDTNGPGEWFPEGSGGSTDTDAILQFDGCDKCSTAVGKGRFKGSENIGCNHKSGKYWYAHVAFADGHTEKLRVDGLTSAELKELTAWLCKGVSVGRNGNRYEEMK